MNEKSSQGGINESSQRDACFDRQKLVQGKSLNIADKDIDRSGQRQSGKEGESKAKHDKTMNVGEASVEGQDEHNYEFHAGDQIMNLKKGTKYTALQLLGKGTFGQVLLVQRSTGHKMALKVYKKQPAYIAQGIKQVNILRHIATYQKKTGGSPANYLNLYDAFEWNEYLCVAMEQMDNSLFDILNESHYSGLEMKWIQIWAKEILLTLAKIHQMGVFHCDIKPQNIMFRPSRPQKPLLIDFSSSCRTQDQPFQYFQSRFYRSPQVIFGILPFTGKIDIWSLGCVLAQLYLGLPLFPGACQYDQVSKIYTLLHNRFPSPSLIKISKKGLKYFQIIQNQPECNNQPEDDNGEEDQDEDAMQRPQNIFLKSEEIFKQETSEKVIKNDSYFVLKNFDSFLNIRNPPKKQLQSHELFVDLLKKMLVIDPEQRFSAEEAFLHPFIGGMHSQLDQLRGLQQIFSKHE